MKKAAPWLIILSGVLWGTLGVSTRVLSGAGLTSMQIVIVRAWGTVLLLFPLLFLYNKELLRIRMKDLRCFLGTGVCSIVFFNCCYFKTMTLTSLSAAAVLLYTAPMIVVLLSAVLFGEKLTRRKLAAMVLAFAGCVLTTGVFRENGALSPLAIITGLGAGLGYALYSIFGRYALNRGYAPFTITAYTFLSAAVVLIPLADPGEILQTVASEKEYAAMAGYMIIFGTVAAYIVYTMGLSCVEAGKASILASVEPVVATVTGMIAFGERLKADGVLGMLLVMTAILFLNLPGKDCTQKNTI
ncbi:MAG: EamA family transporter [Lachnospiraceae bacterium]|nr:EamA family transporter [Lachnospiraceae bacterium]